MTPRHDLDRRPAEPARSSSWAQASDGSTSVLRWIDERGSVVRLLGSTSPVRSTSTLADGIGQDRQVTR